MKIVVLVKYVPDATGERGFAPDGTVDRAGGDGLLSELDEYAVEQALQISDESDTVEVVVLTLGPDDAADAIKRALQMGASAGIHINDAAVHGSDALATSAASYVDRENEVIDSVGEKFAASLVSSLLEGF